MYASLLRYQPSAQMMVLQPDSPRPAAGTKNPPISVPENTSGQFSCSCYVSTAGELGLCSMPSSLQLLVWGRLHLCMHDGGGRQKGIRWITHWLKLLPRSDMCHFHRLRQVTRPCLPWRGWRRDMLLCDQRNISWASWRISTQEDWKTCPKSKSLKGGRSGTRIQDCMVHGLLTLLPCTVQELRIKFR